MTKKLRRFKTFTPSLATTAWVDASAVVIGDCELGEDVSVWPNATLRGDVNAIRIGARSNIQDGCVCHTTHSSDMTKGSQCLVGEDVTVGHNVVLHGCMIEDQCLIGMGSVVLDNAVIRSQVMIGANSLVPPNKELASGHLYLGSPVKQIRPLTEEEKAFLTYSAQHYVRLKNTYAEQDAQSD
ncbi:gamma carbonic anhydrase family protein [Thiomicrospira sp. WB1]|uniref:gamma carbonic anhydrase family protein n=1 Tax=Thiomicrospira sp. WB1 TaxID=1685380 RepID=UPI00074973A1|nr:gamma carbonic anhydrase family protein [Thiomicrospira sp. WB1]KUJ71238.1 gamma carbonic anhydrase family protein [Thiomicrospira sp. WB1]